jgi:hypothetical protein
MPRPNEEALSRPFRTHRREQAAAQRPCDRPGCESEGLYRAPRDRKLETYYHFCLAHVREYNRAWNYYAGMNEAQVEAERRRDATWGRPSWPFGSIGAGPRGFRDDFGFFDAETRDYQQNRQQWEQGRNEREQRRANGHGGGAEDSQDRALAELGLAQPVTFQTVKARYKELVKRFHPDANGGDRTHEDRLKTVNQAYATLRAAYR